MQISSEVIKVLEYLGTKLGMTIDWTSANVLPYVEQLYKKFIVWQTNTSIAWIWIVSIIFIISTVLLILVRIFIDWGGFEWFLIAIAFVISALIIIFQIFDIIECKVFPEKALYDYINLYIGS